jgi:predicted deacetylase
VQRSVAITVHDVAPATLPACRALLAMLDDVGASPLTLLVVPHYHYRSDALREPAFLRAMEARLARGDELALHGLFHLDDAPSPRDARGWFERRLLTRREGEFAALDEDAAAWRIRRGVAFFRSLDWPLAGFVPPAWLMSPGARRALSCAEHPFEYTTTRSGIYRLPDWRFERTANLCYSPDSALRRAVSACAIARESRRARGVALLRISLHPQDALVPVVMKHWRRLVVDALEEREPVTKRGWVRRVRQQQEMKPRSPMPRTADASEPAVVSQARAIS